MRAEENNNMMMFFNSVRVISMPLC